jgi:NitT/TauT family transport system substrate-binding protein
LRKERQLEREHIMTNRRGFGDTPSRRAILTGASAGAAAAFVPFPKPAIAQPARVRYTLSWLPIGQYAFIYMARQLGFWKQRGIEMEIARGYGSMGAIQGISGDKFDMGGAATGAVILSRTRGLDIKILGTQGYDAGLGILAPANGPIKAPKDLAGKTIGVTAAGGDTPFLPAYCKAAGIDYASLDIVSLDSQIIEASVINGRVDAMVAFAMSSIPNFVTQNFPVTLLRFSDYGIDFYWVNTLARQGFIEKNPQLVRDVQAGMMDGLKWTMLNPEEAVERHLKEQQELAISKNAKLFTELGVGMLSSINIVPETEQNGLGYTDLDKIDQQAKQVVLYTGKPDDPPPPPAKDYVINLSDAMPKLTADEWRTVRERSKSYAQMLGRA